MKPQRHHEAEDSFDLFVKELQYQVAWSEAANARDASLAAEHASIGDEKGGEPEGNQHDPESRLDVTVTDAAPDGRANTPAQNEDGPLGSLDTNENLDDDSGYFSGRKRFKLTVNQYKALRSVAPNGNSAGDEHRTFERISPSSKFYRTPFEKGKDPVRRLLFPGALKKRLLSSSLTGLEDGGAADKDNDFYDSLSPSVSEEVGEPVAPEVDPLTPYKHSWTEHDLILLYALKRWYELRPSVARNVLNRCLGVNMSSNAYSMQFMEFSIKKKQKERNLQVFKKVFIETPFDDPEGKWDAIKEELQAAAESTDIALTPRAEDDKEVMKAYEEAREQQEVKRMRGYLAAFVCKSPTLPTKDLNDVEVEPDLLDTPSKIPEGTVSASRKRGHAMLSEATSTPRYQKTALTLPKDILFRYWDDASFGHNSPGLIRAGLFRDISQPVPAPPEINTPEFDKHAANHINRKKVATPMISTSNSLMWALRKAALSRRSPNATNPKIAVIDPTLLNKTFEVNEFIKGLCQRQKMIPAAHRYGGHYDILVWGEIAREAIVNVIDYLELLRATSVPRHIHVHFRMDITCRPKVKGIRYGMKFAVACTEELPKAIADFSDIVLGGASRGDIEERFKTNVGIDWFLAYRQESQSVSRYFLPA
ncbi:hypothetical protein DRE_01107 [Drechslerella stenobrocha 248]|uniref:DUF7587 domain-containing protein n=1 Tax=Drechslerella stenobrocha 248 TaxID=1043628 RepID=W7HJX4_9PEZI|nr:hypothetical protein DRE_01107 [Drechslerella stenobrocha 248]